jgi:iron uptake system component EfeO
MRLDRVAHPALMATVLLGVAACSQPAGPGAGGAAGTTGARATAAGGPIQVTATDTACTLSATTAPAGTITFQVKNTGTKVNEFYVYAAGDRVVGEVENVSPGLSRELKVEITEPGTFQTACKPGMVGSGIRADFTVTGTATAGSADEKVAKAITDYKAYVAHEAEELVEGTEKFVAAIKAGKVAEAKALYPQARSHWEEIEPVAESFGDLDPKIDGREDVIAEGMAFTGYHRLEKDLWVDGLKPDSAQIADQLLADVKQVQTQSATVELTALQIANGSKALLDEVATGKITGEEERYSHTDLWDFEGNVKGSKSALAALRPVLQERDPSLPGALDERFATLEKLLGSHRVGDGFKLYTDLTKDDIKALTVALDALSEQVAKVPSVVEK